MTRREAIAALTLGAPAVLSAPLSTDIRIAEVQTSYEDFQYRTPYKFGGSIVDRVTLCNVRCRVEGRNGRSALGAGSMSMGNMWSFPSTKLNYAQTLSAMKELAERIRKLTLAHREWGHPIDINVALAPQYFKAASEIRLAEAIPPLCTLVTASPFDLAIHDAYGKLHGRNSYQTLGPEFLKNDLGHYLGPDFRGETLDRYVLARPTPRLPLYHSVGAVDPIFAEDVTHPVGDGLPETLPEWIRYNGITHIKIKLNGNDRDWDLNRVIRVHQAAANGSVYSLDFNEKCPNVEYLMEFLHELKSRSAEAYARIQYIEQPTARDLKANPQNTVHEAAKLIPVVIDESLVSTEAFLLALEMGYSGAALKACKGQTESLLIAALGQKKKVFLCVQDLTCSGASLVESVALAAHIPGVKAIEANARQYVPAANAGWEKKFPGIFIVKDGLIRTEETLMLCMFSKHFPELNYEQLGKTCRELGFSGIDLTVRPKGHVLPERVAEDLPRAVDALRKAGLEVPMITTEITSVHDVGAILKTAAGLGISYFKAGYWRYNSADPITRIKEVAADIRGIAELAAEHKICMGLHNHSGTYVGEAVWDTWEMIRDLDPRWTGFYYDPGHATIEGGLGGREVTQRLVTPHLKMVSFKDFYWKKAEPVWCPMGEGVVNWKDVFDGFAKANFNGPMSLHLEYDGGMDVAARIAAVKKDVLFILNRA